MIEINLVPGSARSAKRRTPKLSLGPLKKIGFRGAALPKFDKSVALMGGAWACGLALLGWMFLGGRHHVSTLTAEIEAAQLDSVRLESAIKSQADLEARRNVVAQKVTIVQDIDANCYVWSHIHDEVARAVPEYTWLVAISFMQADSGAKLPHFQVQGRTGNNFALTKYLQQLEQSPFIRKVELKESQLVREDNKLVYSFLLEADYETPPPDVLETVPLFANNDVQLDSAAATQPAPQGAAPRAGAQSSAPQGKSLSQKTAPGAGATPASPAQAQPRQGTDKTQATGPQSKTDAAPTTATTPAPVKKEPR